MLAFISYPREFEEYANTLATELRVRGISIFLDKEIPPTERWRLEIERNIEEADIYIVFYLPSATTKVRYFYTEINRIQKALETSLKNLITVIFAPAKPKDLLPFYRNYQLIQVDSNETETDYWVDQIIMEIERLRKSKEKEESEKKRLKQKLKYQTIFAIFLIISGIITIFTLHTQYIGRNNSMPRGESVCKSLIGRYKLDQEYIFSTEKNAKSIANTNTTWKAERCKYNKENDTFILKGSDHTEFDVEIAIKDKNVRIATITIDYPSEVTINNKDGKLVSRFFDAIKEPTNVEIYPTGKDKKGPNLDEDFIEEKIRGILNFRDEKHRFLQTKGCEPAKGEKGHRLALAFICHDYTRVMVKIPV